MKAKQNIPHLLLMLMVLLASCSGEKLAEHSHEGLTYTCPMHPQVVQGEPGTCPVCGMDLVLFDRSNKEKSLHLSDNQQQLANVKTTLIGSGSVNNETYLNARLSLNPEQTHVLSSRLPGRIEVLQVKETGLGVSKGQSLYRLYSEQLLTLQQEYLLMEEQAAKLANEVRFRELAAAARKKLLLLGQSPSQLSRLKSSGKTEPYISFTSPVSGTVAELMISEGQYVDEGTMLMRIEGYDHLWVEADIYASESSGIREGTQLEVLIPGSDQGRQSMKVEFISPALGAGSQTLQIRGSIANSGNLKPGMPVNVILPGSRSDGGLTLPVDAVIRDGHSQLVWVETQQNSFEPRKVKTGLESADEVEILEGLKEGDRVVTSGAYLLYSEYILKKGEHP